MDSAGGETAAVKLSSPPSPPVILTRGSGGGGGGNRDCDATSDSDSDLSLSRGNADLLPDGFLDPLPPPKLSNVSPVLSSSSTYTSSRPPPKAAAVPEASGSRASTSTGKQHHASSPPRKRLRKSVLSLPAAEPIGAIHVSEKEPIILEQGGLEGLPSGEATTPDDISYGAEHVVEWSEDCTTAAVRVSPDMAVGVGDNTPFELAREFGALTQIKPDRQRMEGWPKDELPRRIMNDLLRAYQSGFFLAEEYSKKRTASTEFRKALELRVRWNKRLKFENKTLKGRVDQLSTSVSSLESANAAVVDKLEGANVKIKDLDSRVQELEVELARTKATFSEVIDSLNSEIQDKQCIIERNKGLIDQLLRQHVEDQSELTFVRRSLHDLVGWLEDP